MNDHIIENYRTLLKKYGMDSRAVQWWDKESHWIRFKLLASVSSKMNSVLDIGCGFADFYHFLRSRGFNGQYLGIDIVPEFVSLAKESIKDCPNAEVRQLDIISEPLPVGFDYGFASGIFNNHRENAHQFVYETLSLLWDACEKGIAFNAISTYVDYFDDELFYVNPMEMLEFLKGKLGGNVVMYHDYVVNRNGYPYEMTFHVFKEPRSVDEHFE